MLILGILYTKDYKIKQDISIKFFIHNSNEMAVGIFTVKHCRYAPGAEIQCVSIALWIIHSVTYETGPKGNARAQQVHLLRGNKKEDYLVIILFPVN